MWRATILVLVNCFSCFLYFADFQSFAILDFAGCCNAVVGCRFRAAAVSIYLIFRLLCCCFCHCFLLPILPFSLLFRAFFATFLPFFRFVFAAAFCCVFGFLLLFGGSFWGWFSLPFHRLKTAKWGSEKKEGKGEEKRAKIAKIQSIKPW